MKHNRIVHLVVQSCFPIFLGYIVGLNYIYFNRLTITLPRVVSDKEQTRHVRRTLNLIAKKSIIIIYFMAIYTRRLIMLNILRKSSLYFQKGLTQIFRKYTDTGTQATQVIDKTCLQYGILLYCPAGR